MPGSFITTSHPICRGLLQNVLDDPASDAKRLIVADWLEENEEGERAEFVRIQCKLYIWLQGNVLENDVELHQQERKLFWKNGVDWMPDIPGITQKNVRDGHHRYGFMSGSLYGSGHVDHPGRIDCDFQRGFLSTLTLTAEDFRQHGPTLVANHPIEEVRLKDIGPQSPPFPDWLHEACGADRQEIGVTTEEELRQFLSDNCIRWAKQAALRLQESLL